MSGGELPSPQAFRKRFALAAFDDGGIVVDVQTGSYWRLNSSAALLLGKLDRATTTEEAADGAAIQLGIPRTLAEKELETLIHGLHQPGSIQAPIGSFRYLPSPNGGYDLWDPERPVLHTDESGRRLTLQNPIASLTFPILECVSEIVPKMLFLHGITALHGSSCSRNGGAIAMCGQSRAGKTTTARCFVENGYELISEDLLIFGRNLADPQICAGAETNIRQRVREMAHRFEGGESSIDTSDLASAGAGPLVNLDTLWFLDAQRRGEVFQLNHLARADGLSLLMTNCFLGASDSVNWRRYLENGRAIIAAVEAYQPDLPDGLERLNSELARYTTNSAS